MAMAADYSFELISIETYVPQFIGHNKLFLGSVHSEYSLSEYLKKSLHVSDFKATKH